MQRLKLIEEINEIERKFDVEDFKVNNVCIWPVIRLRIFWSNIDSKENPYFEKKPTNKLKNYWRYFLTVLNGIVKLAWASIKDRGKNSHPDRNVEVVLLASGASHSLFSDKWYEVFLDPFFDILKESGIVAMLMMPLHHYRIPRYNPSFFIQTALDLKLFLTKLKRPKMSLSAGFERKLDAIKEYIDQNDKHLDLPDIDSILKEFKTITLYSEYFTKIFSKCRPKLGILVCYYDTLGFAFDLACHNSKIKSMDVQHGVQGDYHVGYGRWESVPEVGYELLPDYFWLWSKYEKEAIDRWAFRVKRHNSIIGGNVLEEIWKKGKKDFVIHYDKIMRNTKASCKGKINMLFTAQGIIKEDVIKEILKAIKDTQELYNWWIRLHPRNRLAHTSEIKHILGQYGITRYCLKMANEVPLYSILKVADIHLTSYSSVVCEAARFGVPSVVTSESSKILFPYEISTGLAKYASEHNEILEAIEEQIKFKRSKKYEDKADKFSSNDHKSILLDLIN